MAANKDSDVSISLTDGLIEQYSKLFISQEYADVVFIVEKKRITAHRLVLATRSEYFRAMLFGKLSESQKNEIELPDVPLAAFKTLLKYLYTGQLNISLDADNPNTLLDQLYLVHLYNLVDLVVALSEKLLTQIRASSVSIILNAACLYELAEVKEKCLLFYDLNALEMIKHDSLNVLQMDAFVMIIDRDSFCVPELEIFEAILRWKKHHPEIKNIQPLISCVRFTIMDVRSLVTNVRDSGIIEDGKLCDIIKEKTTARHYPLRVRRTPQIVPRVLKRALDEDDFYEDEYC